MSWTLWVLILVTVVGCIGHIVRASYGPYGGFNAASLASLTLAWMVAYLMCDMALNRTCLRIVQLERTRDVYAQARSVDTEVKS